MKSCFHIAPPPHASARIPAQTNGTIRASISSAFPSSQIPSDNRLGRPVLAIIVTPTPIQMKVGTLIDYRMSIHGVPVKWKTRIAEWAPPHRFADEQLKGPYRLWYHTHTFEPDGDGTRIGDHIEYRPIGGALVNALFVKRDVRKIFEYRQRVLATLFPESQAV